MSRNSRGLRVVNGEEVHDPKASLVLRLGARVFDVGLAYVVFRTTGSAGAVMALLTLLFGDGMLNGQSIGKRVFGIRVIHLPTRRGAWFRDSVLRNAPWGGVVILSMMQDIGRDAFLASAVVVTLVEGILVLRHPQGLRLGDEWAQTQVIDGKQPAESMATARPATAHAGGG